MSDYKLLIDGNLVDGAATMSVVNPATEERIADCPRATAEQAHAAVAAAKAAFSAWAVLPIAERRAALLRFADALNAQAADLARLLVQEQGKPFAEAEAELLYTEAFVRHFAAMDLPIRVIEDGADRRVEMHRKPLGVVVGIVPWNFPVLIACFKLAPALIAGNCIVIKPAPTTPLTALRIGEICADCFPAGIVNVITDANDLGTLLTTHPDVAKVTFTGSTPTGRKVMAAAADTIKRITLELGGNDAGIVLDDVDPKVAAPGIFAGAFMNAGQVCIAMKRLYVHESIYDTMYNELARLADEAVVDDGLKQGTQIGPLQNAAQYAKVQGYLDAARRDGNIIAGGQMTDGPGYFMRPTIVRDIAEGSSLVDEEQFGPILPVIRYSNVADAIARANASPYGLGGSVWATDKDRAYAVANEIEAGTVWINKHLEFGPNIPFGGAKQSGLGVEFAEEGLNEYTQIRVLNIAR